MTTKRRSHLVPLFIAVLVMALFLATIWFLWSKSRPKPAAVQTAQPAVSDVVRKIVAPGTIQPRREVEVKPKVPGILKALKVEAGQLVKRGTLLAEVEIIPDVVSLNEAELRLRSARLAAERTKRERDRAEALGAKGVAAQGELDRLRSEHALAQEELRGAEMRVRLVREGSVGRSKTASTLIEATVDGMVLSLPVREGSSVINASSFNPGTTIAVIADMTDMIFKGRVDEAEVDKLREAMPVEIVVGAMADTRFAGTLEHISPKSLAKEGTTEFEIEAAFRPPAGVTVRAGYSANANIVLARRDKVLTIDEGLLIFEGDKRFVEVQTSPGQFQRRAVKLGLSDGLKVEVLGGVTAGDVIRRPAPAGAPPS